MRYFLEVKYKGTAYSGFQIQKNSNTVQAEVERAIGILLKRPFELTGSSRTDAGVHALQNYFHFDCASELTNNIVYNLNAMLPGDIAIVSLKNVNPDAHCRFDAIGREYEYFIYQVKNPFLKETAFYFPYTLDFDLLDEAAQIIKNYTDFSSFSKRKTQVKSFDCKISTSEWIKDKDKIVYRVIGNRFLRGMVRALTATMLKVGRNKMNIKEFREVIEARDCRKASFAVPPQGLVLKSVQFPESYF